MIATLANRRALLSGVAASLVAAAVRAQPATPVFTFDFRRAFSSGERAALDAWGRVLNAHAASWWDTITTELASPGFTPVSQITLAFTDITIRGVPALTRGSTIEVDARGLLGRIRDADTLGMVAHEMVHVAQRYPRAPGWLVEGIADYMRYYVLVPDDPARAFRPEGATWHDGYQASAGWLDWLEQQHPGTITRLNAGLRAGGDGSRVLGQTAGDAAASWAAYLASKPVATSPEAWRRRLSAQRAG